MNNFTLIIPTHNRHHYLNRSIAYYKFLDAEIIYCDSSSEKYTGELPYNIQYLHLPNRKFAEKILFALNKINTDFVALCADDDFILIESLYKGIAFLSKNKNYSTVVGEYITFKEQFDGNYYSRYNSLPKDIDYSPSKNVEEFFQNYYQILWAMYNKEIITKAFNIINQAKFQNDNFIELVIGACACNVGGIKFFNEIWGVRELNVQDHWGARHSEITDIQSHEMNKDYRSFKELLDKETFSGYAELVISSYLKFQNKNNIKIINIIKLIIPIFILEQIKKLKQRTHSPTLHALNRNTIDSIYLSKITTILKSNSKIPENTAS